VWFVRHVQKFWSNLLHPVARLTDDRGTNNLEDIPASISHSDNACWWLRDVNACLWNYGVKFQNHRNCSPCTCGSNCLSTHAEGLSPAFFFLQQGITSVIGKGQLTRNNSIRWEDGFRSPYIDRVVQR